MKNTIQEPQKTRTTVLSQIETLQFKIRCNEDKMSESEIITYLVKSIITNQPQDPSLKNPFVIQDKEEIIDFGMQKETEMFYESFRRLDHKKPFFNIS
jgi:hypothetical protein